MKRALLVSKQPTKRIKTITTVHEGAEALIDDGFTQRMLLSMVFDVSQLAANVERMKIEVFTLAKAHGIVPTASE